MKCYFIDWTTNWADEIDIYSAEVFIKQLEGYCYE